MAANESVKAIWKFLCEVLSTTHCYLSQRVENNDPAVRAAAATQLQRQDYLVGLMLRSKPVSGESADVQLLRLKPIEDLVEEHQLQTFEI